MVKEFIKRIIKVNIIFASIMMLYRIIFILYYSDISRLFKSLNDLLEAFFLGVRFDIAVLAYINFIVILLFILFLFVGKQKLFIKFVKSLKYYYTLFFNLIVILLCIDFAFYSYFLGHVNYLFFELFNHKIPYLFYISKNEHLLFFILFCIFVIALFFIFYSSKYILEKNIDKYNLYNNNKKIISVLCLLVILILSLNVSYIKRDKLYVYFSLSNNYNYFLENIVISSSFFDTVNLIGEYLNKPNWIKIFGYENNIRKAFSDFLDKNESDIPKDKPELSLIKSTHYNNELEKIKPNIVLIVAESLGTDLLYYNSEKFNIMGELKKHFDEDIVFYNCLYSYYSTKISVDNILLNFIKLPKTSNMFSHYSFTHFNDNCFTSNVGIYRQNNYYTYNLSGGLLDLSNKMFDDVKNTGWNDKLIFEDIFNMLESNNEQKFIFCTTVTNHHPFDVPKDYKPFSLEFKYNINSVEFNKYLQSYQYSCQIMGEFLTKLKNSKYADNTIVAIVGDHRERLPDFDNNIIQYRSVPFYLYTPEKLKPNKEEIDTTKIISHFDILPTLYDISLSSVSYYSIGRSVFDKNYYNEISSNYDNALIVNGDDMCFYDLISGRIDTCKLIRREKNLVECENIKLTEKHKKMLVQYKAAIAISQYLQERWKNKGKI